MIKFFLSAFFITTQLNAQNIYSKKLDNCITTQFCLDCGDIKANVDKSKFDQLVLKLNTTTRLQGVSGKVEFQVLVDSTGKGCVLSHSDISENIITKQIVEALNNFNGFIPAKTKGIKEETVSFNMSFEIKNNSLNGKVERVDQKALIKAFDKPINPKIENKNYVYKNESLKNYKITVWNSNNSNLPNNENDHIAIDKKGIIWLTINGGLVTFDGKYFNRAEQNITNKGKYFYYGSVAVDNDNTKWVSGKGKIYSFDDKKWEIHDEIKYDLSGFENIINNPKTSEVFFCSANGLKLYNNGKWSELDKNKTNKLPSNRVTFAKKDSRDRIWISTFYGTILIDENGYLTNFNETKTILKNKCISSMDEDENGNLYFSIAEYDYKYEYNLDVYKFKTGGLGILLSNGNFQELNVSNSGIPVNTIGSLLYDKREKVLWISTKGAGLVRYNLKDEWENYHSNNSEIPTSYISTMAFDNNGTLYLATRQGLVRVERK